MKKNILLLFTFLASINFMQAAENPRKTLVVAIARTDLEGVTKALQQINDMTPAEQHKYLRMADQVLDRPLYSEIGVELLKAAGFGCVTYLCIAPTLFSYLLTYASFHDYIHENRLNSTTKSVLVFIGASALATGITCFAGIKTAGCLKNALKKPEQKREVVFLIKEAIANHQVI